MRASVLLGHWQQAGRRARVLFTASAPKPNDEFQRGFQASLLTNMFVLFVLSALQLVSLYEHELFFCVPQGCPVTPVGEKQPPLLLKTSSPSQKCAFSL